MRKLTVLIFLCAGCLDPYAPPASRGNLNALVVDASLNSDGSASVTLSRSIPLDGKDAPPVESGAVITIESSGGEVFSLHEDSRGSYSASGLAVDKNSTYTLHIITVDDRDYRSDAMKIYSTPPIDSVYYTIDDALGLEIRVDSHSTDSDNPGYYLVNGIETYEYHAAVYAHFGLKNHIPFERTPEQDVFVCYQNERTHNLVASTRGLKENRLTGSRVSVIARTSPKISVRYSILVKLKAISEEEYTYQRLLLMTTEQQGSLFAQIPGAVTGNMHSTTDPNETVLGYFSAQEVQERRYFINTATQLPKGFYIKQIPANCQPEPTCLFPTGEKGACIDASALSDQAGIIAVSRNDAGEVTGYLWVYGECSDCTVKGGTTEKPSFW